MLSYFDAKLPTVLQCGASEKGLEACLLQDGYPVVYASRSLTTSETAYAQIEKEMLAIVFAMERFDTYVYDRKMFVESDHKPLESICKKGLQSTPKRLQRMLLCLQRYEFEVVYKRGTEMYLADTLSRAFLPLKTSLAGNKEQVMGAAEHSVTAQEVEHINMVDFLPVSEELEKKIQKKSNADKEMGMLKSTIREG